MDISIKDFLNLGFGFGDACDVVLENDLYRYEFESVPVYNGYYTKTGDSLLCGYGYAGKECRGVFANFRAVSSEAMKEDILFRSASPFDNANNRAPYVNELAKANGIDYVLNLADSQAKIDKYKESEGWPELDYSPSTALGETPGVRFLGAACSHAGGRGEE